MATPVKTTSYGLGRSTSGMGLMATIAGAGLLANPWFRTFVAGAGFFADSYDLFVTDGVGNIIKNLGPANSFATSYKDYNGVTHTFSSYTTFLCYQKSSVCSPFVYANTTDVNGLVNGGTWVANPKSQYNDEMAPRYQTQTTFLKNGLNNAASFGNVIGQVLFGVLGDLLGRKTNFIITSTLIILGCLGAATSAAGFTVNYPLGPNGLASSNSALPSGSWNDVYGQVFVWRGILGLGVGGEYPLASTITAEAATAASRGVAVLSIFSMQGWGKLTASIINYSCIATLKYYGGTWTADSVWRFAFAFGCVPNLLTLFWRFKIVESEIYTHSREAELAEDSLAELEGGAASASTKAASDAPSSPSSTTTGRKKRAMLSFATTMAVLWEYRYTLIGTASTWFLIDVTFYGQSLMNTTVVYNSVASTSGLNSVDKLRVSLLGTVYVMLIALPGYWVAIALIDRMGRYWMTQTGFLMSTIWFSVLAGAYFSPLRTSSSGAGFVIVYGLTYFFANFGPNSTTFLMPVEVYPTRIRATAHGISAAVGKCGAIVGAMGLLAVWYSYCTDALDSTGAPNCTATFAAITTPLGAAQQNQSDNGVVTVMAICAGVSFLGNIMTTLFVKETGGKTLEEVDAGCKTLAAHDAAQLQLELDAGAETRANQPLESPGSVTAYPATSTA